ncbi:MAG: hypothetical protein RIC87_13065 [Kiloniellales bacterium]
MSARNLPYLVGAFMLIPLVLWMGLWAFVLPGPNHGTELPLAVALGVVSLPLVAWFYLASLSMLANSIENANAYGEARHPLVRKLVASLPAAALLLGALSLPVLALAGEPLYLTPVPLLVAAAIAWAIPKGEAARLLDQRSANGERVEMLPVITASAKQGFAVAGRLLFRLPVLGPWLREGLAGSNRDKGYFALTLLLGAVLAVMIFGYPALIASALTATLLAFVFITFTILG